MCILHFFAKGGQFGSSKEKSVQIRDMHFYVSFSEPTIPYCSTTRLLQYNHCTHIDYFTNPPPIAQSWKRDSGVYWKMLCFLHCKGKGT